MASSSVFRDILRPAFGDRNHPISVLTGCPIAPPFLGWSVLRIPCTGRSPSIIDFQAIRSIWPLLPLS